MPKLFFLIIPTVSQHFFWVFQLLIWIIVFCSGIWNELWLLSRHTSEWLEVSAISLRARAAFPVWRAEPGETAALAYKSAPLVIRDTSQKHYIQSYNTYIQTLSESLERTNILTYIYTLYTHTYILSYIKSQNNQYEK